MIPAISKERCLLCGEKGDVLYSGLSDARYTIPGCWTYRWCRGCRLAWLDPQPAPDQTWGLYPASYETHTVETAERRGSFFHDVKRRVRGALLAGFGYRNRRVGALWAGLAAILLRIRPVRELLGCSVMWLRGNRGGRLLDVGCGNGWFLSKMRDLGWQVWGVEPDAVAADLARTMRGLHVDTGTLEDVKLPDDFFDAVTLHHVIEHIPCPKRSLEECYRVVRAGGRLVIVTPNFESGGFQRFGPNCWHLEAPRHLYLYSLRSLQQCVEQAGFKTVQCCTMARTAKDVFILSELIRRNGGRIPENRRAPLGVRLRGVLFAVRQHAVLAFRKDYGEEILLVAEKPGGTR